LSTCALQCLLSQLASKLKTLAACTFWWSYASNSSRLGHSAQNV
jgi:hypothetical protein